MDVPAISKILLPRPLELYSTEDLKSALPKGARPWLNRYEDPVEPFKCWSPEQFSSIYSKPAFYFLVACVALCTPMFTDPKLTKLCSALSEHWGTEVSFERIPPHQDWMLCSIPSPPGPTDKAYEILSTALICLSDGNASFVVRHITPASTIRDLDITIRGSTVDASAVFQQVKKKQLEFESSGVFIRWRIVGVRPSNAVSKYRATFLLNSSATFWPWSHSWQHLHASIPPSHNLLDFPPTWSARKGYACQSCHNSDHFTMECPLAHIRISGTPLVSHVSMTLAINKRPAERLVAVDRSLNPRWQSASAPDPITAAFAATPIPDSSPPRPKSPNTTRAVDTAYRFLAAKLHSIMDRFPGLSLGLIQSLCSLHSGDIPMVIANFRSCGMDIPWDSDALDQEWSHYLSQADFVPRTLSLPSAPFVAPTPPQYCPQVKFIEQIIAPLPPFPIPANIPELVQLCHGSLPAILRRLEVVHRAPLPPWTEAAMSDQFSDWLINSWSDEKSCEREAPRPGAAHQATPAARVPSPGTNPLFASHSSPADPPSGPMAPPAVPLPVALKFGLGADTPMADVQVAMTNQARIIAALSSPTLHPLPPSPTTGPASGMDVDAPSSQPSLDAALASFETPPGPAPTPAPPLALLASDPPSASTIVLSLAPMASASDFPPNHFVYSPSSPAAPLTNPHSPPPWPLSQDGAATQLVIPSLAAQFPSINESMLWQVLQMKRSDTAAAATHLSALCDLSRKSDVLQQAFPAAPGLDIAAALSMYDSDLSLSYASLSCHFISTWDPSATPAQMLSTITLIPDLASSTAALGPFTDPDPSYAKAERSWWASYIAAKQRRVASLPSCDGHWDSVCSLATSNSAISPRFIGFIFDLGLRTRDPIWYASAVSSLRTLPSYDSIITRSIELHDDAPVSAILPVLLEEGLINPSAAVWLATQTEGSPSHEHLSHFFTSFPARYHKLLTRRSLFLHHLRDSKMDASTADDGSVTQLPQPSALASSPGPSTHSRITRASAKGKGKAAQASIASAASADASSCTSALKKKAVRVTTKTTKKRSQKSTVSKATAALAAMPSPQA
jgi:hypothetical protein